MNKKRTSILTDLEKNFKNTNSIAKSVDLSAIENNSNPHQIYNKIMKDVDNTPEDFPSEKLSVGDMVKIIKNNDNNQYEIINISNKDDITLKNINTDEVIQKKYNEIKPVMENLDMARKKLNETQYTVSINDLTTTDANALSQMMSAAAQADSGNTDVSSPLDMTSTPELPTPMDMDEPVIEPGLDEPVMSSPFDAEEPTIDEPSFEDSDLEADASMDDELPSDISNPLDNPEMSDDVEDDFSMESDINVEEPVDDIEFDEEIVPTEDELEMDIEEPIEESIEELNEDDTINENVLQELYEIICEQMGDDYLSDYDDVDYMELVDCVKDFGNDIEGFDESLAEEYANALQEKWKNENSENNDVENDYDDEEGLEEDILLPKETEDETYNAKKKLEDDEDKESERISEEMNKLINSILENSGAKTEQEVYAEEITKDDGEDEEILDEEDDEMSDIDMDIAESLKNAGVKLKEAKVKPTIVTDESTFANKPNKAVKPEDEKEPKIKSVSTSEFGAEGSEPFHKLPCMKCEAIAPKDKIKKIYETAKVRYSKADKSQWNALDRRYITKLIENGCGYQRATRIILEAKKN